MAINYPELFMINLSGQKFDRLTAIAEAGRRRGYVLWRCACDCGEERLVRSSHLTSGQTKSCGCLQAERTREARMREVVSFDERLQRNKATGCLEWQGGKDKNGYGRVVVDGVTYKAHRYAYQRTLGSIPEGMMVCHKCDNPPCCDPSHLFLGTVVDNANDMIAKKLSLTGERNHKAKANPHMVRQVRKLAGIMTQHQLANTFGISQSSISKIILRHTWQDVD